VLFRSAIKRAKSDPLFAEHVLKGQHQVIVTGTIAGVRWKGLPTPRIHPKRRRYTWGVPTLKAPWHSCRGYPCSLLSEG
jgi:hypothetical protein